MATERKKRKINVIKSKLPKIKKEKQEKSQIKPQVNKKEDSQPTSKLEVIKGSRKRRKVIRIITCSVIALIFISLFVVNLLSPTGIIEMTQNTYAALGSGNFPVNIYCKNATDFNSFGDVNLIVNDSYFEVYNERGKLIQAASHGMSNPRLEVSQARFLLFDRSRYGIKIYNYSNELISKNFEHVIYSADISRNGTYAVVTGSNTYLNTVYVFNKDNDSVYTWNSANYYVADVAVADNGKKIAVCLVNAKGGSYSSAVYVLDFNSVSPILKYEFSCLVSSVSSAGEYLLVNGIDYAAILSWDNEKKAVITETDTIRYFNVNSDGEALIVYGRENNKQINTICYIDKVGNIIKTYGFNSHIDSIDFNDNNICIVSDESLFVYDKSFENEKSYSLNTKPLFVGMTDKKYVVLVDNSSIKRIEILSEG